MVELATSADPSGDGSDALVACASCGSAVDPLRAERVAHIRGRFRYFCSGACRERFDMNATGTPLPVPRSDHEDLLIRVRAASAAASEATASAESQLQSAKAIALVARTDLIEQRNSGLDRLAFEYEAEPPPLAGPLGQRAPEAPTVDVGGVLLLLSVLGAVLSIALILAGDSPIAEAARLTVMMVAALSLAAESLMGARQPTELHPAALLAAPLAGSALALAARLLSDPHTGAAITVASVVIAGSAASAAAMRRARRPIEAERRLIESALDKPCHRVVSEELVSVRASDLRPGEEIVVESGESVPVDATITAGSAEVLPWFGATSPTTRREGDAIVAGAQVESGRLRAVVGWAGFDRAFMRLTNDPRRRADVFAPMARLGRLIAERAAPVVAGFAALAAYASNADPFPLLLLAVGVLGAIAQPGVAEIGGLHVARGVLDSLRRGIVFRTAAGFERAGAVTATAFSARGTLLLGEPEVANIESFAALDPEQVLALVSGAESGESHPVATAVMRAARARGVRPDGVRSPSIQAGLGVTAVAASGQALVVGTRGLMLRERISVASAEARITDLETMGRSVLLVALGGRLVGLVGLQDGLRPGARAAVQHLLDVNVEPVLLSGDARETCEAIGRALDIDHLRPEIPPNERGDEIRRLADSGAVVAVVGRSPADDSALAAADVSIALSAAGSSTAEWSVQLASDDVRDAAYAVRLAHDARRESRLGLALTLAPALIGALLATLNLLPVALAPLFALAGTLAALLKARL
ncbi:MAG TPA: HAD family hydrolase [Polyangiaceae bacterium]|nr:HAD family hydrolase [Polyangiaceae bacterium]